MVNNLNSGEAKVIGNCVRELIDRQSFIEAENLVLPIIKQKTSFRLLDIIGMQVGSGEQTLVREFLLVLSNYKTMGGWVIIASALRAQLPEDLEFALDQAREFTIKADTWYGTDIFGERVPGPALVKNLTKTIEFIKPWRIDPNRWIKRMTGVAVHYWAKQAHGSERHNEHAIELLNFLDPLYSERNVDVVKGVGWGFKTLGRYYPNLVSEWLDHQTGRKHTALMKRKILQYLPESLKNQHKN